MNPTELCRPSSIDPGGAGAQDGLLSPLTALSARIEDRRATVAVVGLGYVGLPLLGRSSPTP